MKASPLNEKCHLIHRFLRWAGGGIALWLLPCSLGLLAFGCADVFSPSFVNLIDPDGSANIPTFDTGPGHVVVALVNNTRVDERLLNWLESTGRLNVTPAERAELRPRVRIRARITFARDQNDPDDLAGVNQRAQVVEFVDGSRNLVDATLADTSAGDLNQDNLDNVVVLCQVESVVLEPGADIEVFIPVEVGTFQQTNVIDINGNPDTITTRIATTPPGFRVLAQDDAMIQRNIDPRDLPSPVISPLCGSVIAIVIEGTLSVPFLDGVPEAGGRPSFLDTDIQTQARIGGEYEFRVSIQ